MSEPTKAVQVTIPPGLVILITDLQKEDTSASTKSFGFYVETLLDLGRKSREGSMKHSIITKARKAVCEMMSRNGGKLPNTPEGRQIARLANITIPETD